MDLTDWIGFFVEFIVPDDLGEEEVVGSFLRHLADLGALVPLEGNWQWAGCDSQLDLDNLTTVVQKDLEKFSDSESGFALPYFIGYKNISKKSLEAIAETDNAKNVSRKSSGSSSFARPASNLSNLQIVKKVGKQLQPFLQIEEAIVSRLVGKHASKQDAQKLFHYMFSKVGSKAGPRAWEQLSRKRHR